MNSYLATDHKTRFEIAGKELVMLTKCWSDEEDDYIWIVVARFKREGKL